VNEPEQKRAFQVKRNLPRLDPDAYRGLQHVSFTATTFQRQRLFLHRNIIDVCVEALRTECDAFHSECLVYCFMPDHVHMVLHGCNQHSDVLVCHNNWKGATGKFLARHLAGSRHWQPRSYDHVLRSHEYARGALRKMIRYILNNPVRAGLASAWQEYPFLGSLIGPFDIRHPYWWDWFYE
jgi:putative transposase